MTDRKKLFCLADCNFQRISVVLYMCSGQNRSEQVFGKFLDDIEFLMRNLFCRKQTCGLLQKHGTSNCSGAIFFLNSPIHNWQPDVSTHVLPNVFRVCILVNTFFHMSCKWGESKALALYNSCV